MIDKFLNHFTASRAHRKIAGSLYGLTQGESKSLKDFIRRFNRKTAQIWNLNQDVALYAFTKALKPSSFAESLHISPPETLDELRNRAVGYIRAEEGAENRKRAREDQRTKVKDFNDERRKKEDRSPRPRGQGLRRQDRGIYYDNRGPIQPIYHMYTTFNTPKSTILWEIHSAGLINLPPPPMFQGSQVDRQKRCEYHRMFGHTTEECV